MTTQSQTEALKLALEGGGLYEITGRIEDIDKCIVHRSVIKEALSAERVAQPSGSVEQEPVAKAMTAHRAAYFMERFKHEEKLLGPNEQAALDFVISMLEAQPEQEPVAVVEELPTGEGNPPFKFADLRNVPTGAKLYTTPPQRKPLTDDLWDLLYAVEIELNRRAIPEAWLLVAHKAGRAYIQAAHGIKE